MRQHRPRQHRYGEYKMSYEEQIQSLITKTTIDIAIIFSLIAFVLVILWIVPLAYLKNKKIKKINKKQKTKSIMAQIALTAICLLFSLITISSFKDIGNMKKDIESNDFVVYTGEYSIDSTYHFTFSISELWFDLRAVTIENDSEPLWFDMMSDMDTDLAGNGTIVYGKNSRYVVLIDSE